MSCDKLMNKNLTKNDAQLFHDIFIKMRGEDNIV